MIFSSDVGLGFGHVSFVVIGLVHRVLTINDLRGLFYTIRSPNRNLFVLYVFIFFKYTIKIEIAAGVTPEIREAWPKLRGLNLVNFSLISRESPLICE